ncbi:hypothetical protein [Mycobacterium sp. OTB74]|uniref:hypothetical protein n=1 Tax=Mycobacterium sp. OTB74 TaxID=1853452 RepID=UPI002475DCF0|nr:hypothetical protein [Mycobacterium sp. OTB74]
MDDSEPGALGVVRKVLSFEMTIAEWIGTAAILAAPYLVIGVIWALTHTSDLAAAYGIRWLLLLVRSIIFWPVILLSNVCF